MSELSFKTFCIEFYSKHIQKPGSMVYELFRISGLLDMLEKDYEDLHGMGQEALMRFFDEYLAKELKEIKSTDFPAIEHNLVRTTVTPEIVRLISKYYKISENEALMRFYQSKTAENYADEDTGLYGQSALHIVGLFIMEQDGYIDESRLQ